MPLRRRRIAQFAFLVEKGILGRLGLIIEIEQLFSFSCQAGSTNSGLLAAAGLRLSSIWQFWRMLGAFVSSCVARSAPTHFTHTAAATDGH
jgi:hypothetical protein